MESDPSKDRKAEEQIPSLEALIDAIDQQVGLVPTMSTAEGFAAFLGGKAEDYQRRREQYVRFTIDETTFALPLQNTLEIDYVPEIVPLPNLPQWVLGICNLRGEIVSVVDIKQILDLPPVDADRIKKLVLIKNQSISTAIIVDSVSGMMFTHDSDSDDSLKEKLEEPFANYIKDVIMSGRQTVHLLDLDALMAAIKI